MTCSLSMPLRFAQPHDQAGLGRAWQLLSEGPRPTTFKTELQMRPSFGLSLYFHQALGPSSLVLVTSHLLACANCKRMTAAADLPSWLRTLWLCRQKGMCSWGKNSVRELAAWGIRPVHYSGSRQTAQ